ncbi:hypothetical protein FQA39_LY06102 [Lamprigera yunnana]|nr:hypothetical protein FQA39_LY06102 [Lamprigera yunnana]
MVERPSKGMKVAWKRYRATGEEEDNRNEEVKRAKTESCEEFGYNEGTKTPTPVLRSLRKLQCKKRGKSKDEKVVEDVILRRRCPYKNFVRALLLKLDFF